MAARIRVRRLIACAAIEMRWRRAGLPAPENYIVVRERVEESGDVVGFQAMQELLKLEPRPDAVFCYNDLTAIGAIEATLQGRAESS